MPATLSALETQVFSKTDADQAKNIPGADSDISKDLGFGPEVARKARCRLLNRDGSFNIHRRGYGFFQSRGVYHSCLNASWPRFFLGIFALYLSINAIFAILYYLCGPEALEGGSATTSLERFSEAFFFSVQTLATIGYGRVSPSGLIANVFVTLEALVGLLGFALATGLVFARFSRPTASILFSDQAVITPYHGKTAFGFRIVNQRNNQIINLHARLVMSRVEYQAGVLKRKFYDLPLERKQVMFFPLNWTIVHPIDEQSPLYQVSERELEVSDAEFMILLSGVDDTFSQEVHCWSSYKHNEIAWNARFTNILDEEQDGTLRIDLKRLNEIERL